MDPLTLAALGAVGYWIFKSLGKGEGTAGSTATPAPPRPAYTPPARPAYVPPPPPPKRPSYATVADCFRAEYVSYSRLRSYTSCPHRFRLGYLEGRESEAHYKFTGPGKGFHSFCEGVFRKWGNQRVPTLREAGRYPDFDVDEAKYEYLHSCIHPGARIVATEHELRFSVRGLAFYGIVDLVLKDHDGITHLVDYKTGENPRTHLEQLEMYCLPVLLGPLNETVRLSFILVDTREHILWEVGPRNREEVVANIFRIIDHMMSDRTFPPRVSSRCKDCAYIGICAHGRSGRNTVAVTWPTLTAAKRGAARRRAETNGRKPRETRSGRAYASAPTYYFVAVAKKRYVCDESGKPIEEGQHHFATKNGRRLSIDGFRTRYPGSPLPTQTKQQRFGPGG